MVWHSNTNGRTYNSHTYLYHSTFIKINSDLPNSSSNCQNLCFFRRKSVSFQIFNIRVALKICKFNVWQVPNVYNLWRYVEHPSIKINQKFNKFSEFSVYWNKFLHIFCTVVKWENLSVNTWILFFSWVCCFHSWKYSVSKIKGYLLANNTGWIFNNAIFEMVKNSLKLEVITKFWVVTNSVHQNIS